MRTFSFLKYLSENHEITLISQYSSPERQKDAQELQNWVKHLILFPEVPKHPKKNKLLEKAKQVSIFVQQGTPPQVLDKYSPHIQQWLDENVENSTFDVLTCEESLNEIYIRSQWQETLPCVLNVHRSFSGTSTYQPHKPQPDKSLRGQLNLSLLRRYESQYCEKFKKIVVSTAQDRYILKSVYPEAQISLISNGLDLSAFPQRPTNQGGQRIVFIGTMDKPANIEAALFFSTEVFPKLRQRYPEAILEIVGMRPTPDVLALGELPQIKVTGEVSSIIDYLHWATVCVIPLQKSVGTKIRTLEAMATGVPVVASDYGLEGLEVDGAGVPQCAMRANSVDEYVYSMGRLFDNPKLREKLSLNGRNLVKNNYTWETMAQKYERLLLGIS
ncbi:MAG: glycosyltransferase family 4 protein [Microcystaceae cyanobacterium]